jgi:polyferredoxin
MLLILFGMIGGALPVVAQEAGQRRPPSFTEFLLQPKFITMFILAAAVFFLLKTHRMRKGIKVALLLTATLLYGIVGNFGGSLFSSFAMHPSPMCAAAKPFLFGLRVPFMVMLSVMFVLTLIGPKLFCGWICPVGAVQELASMAAGKLKLKRRKPRYSLSYGIRLAIFLAFLTTGVTGLLTQTVQGQTLAVNIYDYINPFHGFEFEWAARFVDNVIHYLPFLLTMVLAVRYYRPFCHFVCPIGLYTHFMEQIGLFRISLIKSKCTDCGVCTNRGPCQAFPDILKDANLRPECYACDECVDICPEDALDYGIQKTR